ncbi:MAG: DUF222 domain-containing protein [Acidimicrobiales bacterium]
MDTAADPQVEEVLAGLDAALDAACAVGVRAVDGRDAYGVVRRLEVIGRRVAALQVDLLGDIEARGLHTEDGHRSARGLVGFAANTSGAASGRRSKAARMLVGMPVVAAGFRAGRIGVCQVDRIARVHANPRVREQLEAVDAELAVVAERLRFDELDRYLARWEHLADEDGAATKAERDHRRRDFQVRQNLDGTYRLWGGCGSLQGTVTAEVFDAYVRAELEADWAEARQRLGDAATITDLARTDAQRRMDAVEAIFTNAADTLAARTGQRIVTNLCIDQTTFERTATRLTGTDPGPDPRLPTWWSDLANQPTRNPDTDGDTGNDRTDGPASYRCEGLDGRPVDPTEAVAATLLVGHIRRVVYGADSVVIDLGRRSRLFTGPARLAVMLTATTCFWPGCTQPVHHCQADHLQPWQDDGPTSPGNGAPACGKHNRWRNHGYTVQRDPAGNLHIHRPDGTEIT